MITIIIRSFVLYVFLLVLLRLMGKRQIGQMQPFELVLTLIIADLATLPMGELSVPLLHGIVPLLTLSVLHFTLTIFAKKSDKFNKLVSGKPIIVINPDGIDKEALDKLKLSIDDIFAALREKGFFKLEEVEYAIMETNGRINVLPKFLHAPVTAESLKLENKKESLPVTIIGEGAFLKDNLKVADITEEQVFKILKKAEIKNVKDCLVLTVDQEHNVYIQEKNKKFKYFEGLKW